MQAATLIMSHYFHPFPVISLRYTQIGLRRKFWEDFLRKDGYTDEMSYGSILQACSASASVEKAEKWFRRMLSQGLRPNAVVMCSYIAASRWMMMMMTTTTTTTSACNAR
jgi:pentatricopeptide repeat protein